MPLTAATRDIQVVKCNGNIVKVRKEADCPYQPEYLSQIIILGERCPRLTPSANLLVQRS